MIPRKGTSSINKHQGFEENKWSGGGGGWGGGAVEMGRDLASAWEVNSRKKSEDVPSVTLWLSNMFYCL